MKVNAVRGLPGHAGADAPGASRVTKARIPARSFMDVLGEAPNILPSKPQFAPAIPKLHHTAPPGKSVAPDKAAAPWRRLVGGVAASEREVDGILKAAARGKTFSPAELLALQVKVFRYGQTVDLVSKSADKLIGAVKQTLGSQS